MTYAHENTESQASLGRLLVFTIPLLWAVLVLFHPNPGEGGPFEAIRDDVNRWLIVHVGQLVLTPFLVLAVWRLLDRLPSLAAKVSRAAVVVWAAFFTAYDSIQGISTGVLIRYTEGLSGDQQAGVARALDYLVSDSQLAGNVSAIGLIASAAWLTVAIAAAVALHKRVPANGSSSPHVSRRCSWRTPLRQRSGWQRSPSLESCTSGSGLGPRLWAPAPRLHESEAVSRSAMPLERELSVATGRPTYARHLGKAIEEKRFEIDVQKLRAWIGHISSRRSASSIEPSGPVTLRTRAG